MPPPPVDLGGTVEQLAVGHDHSCVLLGSGNVRCSGRGRHLVPWATRVRTTSAMTRERCRLRTWILAERPFRSLPAGLASARVRCSRIQPFAAGVTTSSDNLATATPTTSAMMKRQRPRDQCPTDPGAASRARRPARAHAVAGRENEAGAGLRVGLEGPADVVGRRAAPLSKPRAMASSMRHTSDRRLTTIASRVDMTPDALTGVSCRAKSAVAG